jgi:hypothetical protein
MRKIILLASCLFLWNGYLFSQCETFFGDLVINEVMPANNSTAADQDGEVDDWVEIFNTTDNPIKMQGYFLSDNHGNRTKFEFPDVTIGPQETLIVWCDAQPEQEGLHTDFRLSATGEEVGLYNPDTISLDYVKYGDTPNDISIGRFPNARGPFKILIPTFDAENTNSVNPGLVINEYQAINESTADDQWGGFDDWIELYNNSNQDIDLTGYFLSDRVGEPTQFEFPDTSIAAGGYLIIWCDQGLFEPGLHTFFKLGSDGDDILLSNRDTLTIDYVRFGPQIPDDSEGRFSNGIGFMECMIPTFEASNGFAVSTNDLGDEKLFEIYPNPARGEVNVVIHDFVAKEIEVRNLMGQIVKEIPAREATTLVDISDLESGLYFVIIGNELRKLVVE